jgi:hypothetical protein
MELSGFEPLTSWVRWKSEHLTASGRNYREGAWLLAFRALAGTSMSRCLGSILSRLDADWTRPRARRPALLAAAIRIACGLDDELRRGGNAPSSNRESHVRSRPTPFSPQHGTVG